MAMLIRKFMRRPYMVTPVPGGVGSYDHCDVTGEHDVGLLRKRELVMDWKYDLGDIVEMKKPHPCRKSLEWEITRMGADIKIKCQGCGNSVMFDRR